MNPVLRGTPPPLGTLAVRPLRSKAEIRRPTICLLALSPIADDPRVRRQGDAFHRHGWQVYGVGVSGGRSAPPNWPIITEQAPGEMPAAQEFRAQDRSPAGALRSAVTHYIRNKPRLRKLVATGWRLFGIWKPLVVRVRPELAEKIFWRDPAIRRLHKLADAGEADIWLANDWNALPVAARLAQAKGGLYGYDTHEFATEEYAEKLRWRLWRQPLVRALEGRFIGEAKVVSAVSGGIARRLDEMYSLPRATAIIRNTPDYERHPFRPTGDRIRVLYHGIVAPGRGLEAAICSVADWRPEFDLSIRGPKNPQFTPLLQARIIERRLEGRVTLLPPVPMTALVREAAAYDIGFFALPPHSRHNEFALPNKFFEYIMAGLAVCVADLPEMAQLARQYGLGVTLPSLDPVAIATVINTLDRQIIDRCKRNALTAARELCWERESEQLLAAYDAVLPQAVA